MVHMNKLAAGITAALALSYGTTAFAAIPAISAIANAQLTLSNFVIDAGNGAAGASGTALDFGVNDSTKTVNITSNTNSSQIQANLSGFAPAVDNFSTSAIGPTFARNVSLGAGYVPATTLAEAPRLTGNATGTFAGGSSTSIGVGLDPTSGDIVHVDSAVSILGTGEGHTQSRQDLNTDFTVHLNKSQTFELSFTADGFLRAALGQAGVNAQAVINWNASITDANGAAVLIWAPDGVVGDLNGSCVAAAKCTEFADAFSLNQTLATGSQTDKVRTLNPGNFEVEVTLAAGDYNFAISHKTSADATTPVPEPMTLALLGMGLVGAGVSRRRKS